MLFTHNIKKIKGVTDKNGDVDGMCKRTFKHMLDDYRVVDTSSCSVWPLVSTGKRTEHIAPMTATPT